jgi:DNA polymerase-3 subunit alpha
VEPWGRGELLREERELMGFYVSGHPLDDFAAEAKAFATLRLGQTEGLDGEKDYAACGIITSVKRLTSKSGRPMAFLTLEDQTGQAEVVLFSQAYERLAPHLVVDDAVLVRGRVEVKGDVKILARDLVPMWRVREQLVRAIVVQVDADTTQPDRLEELAALCAANRGACKLYFEVTTTQLPRPVRLHARAAVVDPTPDLMKGLTRLFGREAVVLEGEA